MQWKTLSILICFVALAVSCNFVFADCPSADVNGDCLVNFLDFHAIALEGNLLDLRTMALQWLESAENDADWEPLTILGRVETGADEPGSFEVEFVVVDKQRLDRSLFQYECRVILENISAVTIENVQLGMVGWSGNMTIIDPHVTFGDARIASGESAASIDTCTFTVDRSIPINPVEIVWHHIVTRGDMVQIPAGEFDMGNHFSGEGNLDELPVHTVTIDTFYMGMHEITNQQYCDYLNSAKSQGLITVVIGTVRASFDSNNLFPYCYTSTASSYSQIAYSNGVFSVRTKSGRDMSNDPMVDVSWYGAAAYCNWRSQQEGKELCYNPSTWDCDFLKNGYRLPTEAEWEYVAQGGFSGKRFPWGDTISHSQANYEADTSAAAYDISPTEGHHPAWNDGVEPYTAPVSSFAANGYGLYDMAGNVWEWCNDWYDPDYYDSSPPTNPSGPTSRYYRVRRGGSWQSKAFYCRIASRFYGRPDNRTYNVGFRIISDSERCEVPDVEVVDDMEAYTPWTVPGNNIFEIWRDSFGDCSPGSGNETGSTVTEIQYLVLGGVQSMMYDYDNDGMVFNPCSLMQEPRPYFYSKIEAQISGLLSGIGSNWNPCDIRQLRLLVINFHGQIGNGIEDVDPLWVELKDADGNKAKVVYGEGQEEYPYHLAEESWHEWFVDMGDFTEEGVDVTDLASISIGIGSEGAAAPGRSGTLYFDEIRLSTSR